MKTGKILKLNESVDSMLFAENSNYQFNKFLHKIQKAIAPIVEEAKEEKNLMQKSLQNTALKYADKDKEGNPKTHIDNAGNKTIQGVEGKTGFIEEKEKVESDYNKLLEQEKEVDLSGVRIEEKKVPDGLKGVDQIQIQEFIKEE